MIIENYIARDPNGCLWLFTSKPEKIREIEGIWCWSTGYGDCMVIRDSEEFKNIKWEDKEPTEVVINIKK